MKTFTLPIYSTEGKEIDTVKLDPAVFDGAVNSAAIYQAVNAYTANQRRGLAATKTRGEVSGGGHKPWKQKGTGRARVGSIRSPLWRHGGVIFGPHPRDFSYLLPVKIKTLALKSGLNEKVMENNFIVLENLSVDKPKTKEVNKVFSNLKIDLQENKKERVLLLLDSIDKNLRLALRNLKSLQFNISKNTNAYEVLSSHKIIITKLALEALTKRMKHGVS